MLLEAMQKEGKEWAYRVHDIVLTWEHVFLLLDLNPSTQHQNNSNFYPIQLPPF
jgi:hypothetical protein